MALGRTVLRIAREGTPPASVPVAEDELVGVYVTDEPGRLEPIEIVTAEDGPVLRSGGHEVPIQKVDDDLFLVPDPAFDRFHVRVERPTDGVTELWHGGQRYVREGADARDLPEPSEELRAIVGHYRSHNPWTTNFRVVLRGDRPWLIFPAAPDGFDDEQELFPWPDGSFRVGEDPGNPEGLRFDTVVDGRALRAWLSGWPYFRAD
jgi:D-alanyl-D-alanine carboxypeptidase